MKRTQYKWTLPEAIEVRLGQTTYGRQRAMYEEEHLLLILHQLPDTDQVRRECIVFLRDPEGKWFCNGQGNGEYKLNALIKSYKDMHDKLELEYDNANTSEALFQLIEKTTPVSRSAQNLHKALQSAREYLRKETFVIGLRDEAYEIARNFDLLSTDLKTALDFRLAMNSEAQAKQAQQMTESQHKLNILAAITFPLMAAATIFGMNLPNGFESANPLIFWLVFFAGISIGLFTKSWVTREKEVPKVN
ncbi:MAG: hypothetical protein GY757_17850 [bacterium]|nr:hypothetical protein [bacterium]